MEDQSLEGRVIAHRQILLLILQELADTQVADRVRSMLQERLTLRDGQEDPGAVEAPGLDIELAMSDEFQLIFDALSHRTGDSS